MNTLPDEHGKRFVAVLNKKIETGKLFNALGHMTAGLAGGSVSKDDMCFLQYRDASEGLHPNISHYPFIVLKADNANQIRTVRAEAMARGIPFTDFTSSMTVGTSAQQMEATHATAEADLDYWGVCMFGETATIKEFTKKFSLFS